MASSSLHDRVLGLARDLILERYGVDLGAHTNDPAVVRLQNAIEATAHALDRAIEAFDAELFDEALAGLGQERARLERTSGETLPTHAQTLGTRLSLFSSPTAQRSTPGSDPPRALEPSDAQLFDEALMGLGGDRATAAIVTQEVKVSAPASMLLFSSPGPAAR